jgi:hypothetical protein
MDIKEERREIHHVRRRGRINKEEKNHGGQESGSIVKSITSSQCTKS